LADFEYLKMVVASPSVWEVRTSLFIIYIIYFYYVFVGTKVLLMVIKVPVFSDVSILQAMQGCQKRIWSIMRRVDDDPRDQQRRPDDVAHY
jgi:hypothetical protein